MKKITTLIVNILFLGVILTSVNVVISGCNSKETDWTSYNVGEGYIRPLAIDYEGQGWVGIGDHRGIVIKAVNCEDCDDVQMPPTNDIRQGINDMVFDQNGRLWVVTYAEQEVLMFDKEGNWHKYPSGKMLSRLLVDQQGFIWVLSSDDLYRLEPTLGNMVSMGIKDVQDMALDGQGRIWVIQQGDLKYLDNGVWKLMSEGGWQKVDSNERITALAISQKGDIWTKSHNGMKYMDKKGNWIEYKKLNEMGEFNDNFIVDGHGRAWVGSQNGLWMLDPIMGWKGYKVTESGLTLLESLQGENPVSYLAMDGKGKLWVIFWILDNNSNHIGNIVGILDIEKIR